MKFNFKKLGIVLFLIIAVVGFSMSSVSAGKLYLGKEGVGTAGEWWTVSCISENATFRATELKCGQSIEIPSWDYHDPASCLWKELLIYVMYVDRDYKPNFHSFYITMYNGKDIKLTSRVAYHANTHHYTYLKYDYANNTGETDGNMMV
jgi:hypothetical protein